jgi:transposase
MIRYSLEHLRFLEEHIAELDAQIVTKIEALGYVTQWELLQTVPALKENTAANVLAEIGPDMSQFESEKNLSSWAGVCPGNNGARARIRGARPPKETAGCAARSRNVLGELPPRRTVF